MSLCFSYVLFVVCRREKYLVAVSVFMFVMELVICDVVVDSDRAASNISCEAV